MITKINRRKYKDNPYDLLIIDGKYFIRFKDSKLKTKIVEVDYKVYDVFNKSELKDISHMHEYERHIEHFEMHEWDLYRKSNYIYSLENEVEKNILTEILINAINSLTCVQKRRIIMYYFENKSTKEIAEKENCSSHSVRVSIRQAIKELEKIIKNNNN